VDHDLENSFAIQDNEFTRRPARWPWGAQTPGHGPVGTLDDHPFTGRVMLVVDDDYRNALALWALLDRGRAEVLVAQSGLEAIETLEQAPRTDLVLMDIMMPGMDGYATMQAIRARERFRTLPIIAVTAKVIDNERGRCIAAGASDYVPKPINTALLLSVMEPWLTSSTPLL